MSRLNRISLLALLLLESSSGFAQDAREASLHLCRQVSRMVLPVNALTLSLRSRRPLHQFSPAQPLDLSRC